MAKNKVTQQAHSITNESHVKKRKGTGNSSRVKKRKRIENEGILSDFNSSMFPSKETHLRTMNRILEAPSKNPRTSSMVEVKEGNSHRLDVDGYKKVHCRVVLKRSMIHKDGLTFTSERKNLEREEEMEKTKPSRRGSEVSAADVKASKSEELNGIQKMNLVSGTIKASSSGNKDLTHFSRQALSTEKTNNFDEPKQYFLDTILAAQSRRFGFTEFQKKKYTEYQRKKETEFQRQKEREAARLKVQKTKRTVFIDNNMESFEELEKLCGHSLSDFRKIKPLEYFFGLVLKE